MTKAHRKALLALAETKKLIRPKDLDAQGIPHVYLRRLTEKGFLERHGRGLYSLPDIEIDEKHNLLEVSRRAPKALICLLSALRFHELTTQAPFEVWIAIPGKAWAPTFDYPPLRIVRFSEEALREGVEHHEIDGASIAVTNPAKTVADCFKFRNKIGLDVALEALRACWGEKKCTMDELSKYAAICRVTNVIRPYLEGLV